MKSSLICCLKTRSNTFAYCPNPEGVSQWSATGSTTAPALAEADVGIAMGSGTDVARESADIVLIGNDLLKLVDTVEIARKTRGIIWQNFVGTIGIDVVGIALAGFGMLNPLAAIFIHVASEIAFILNSACLLQGSTRARVSVLQSSCRCGCGCIRMMPR